MHSPAPRVRRQKTPGTVESRHLSDPDATGTAITADDLPLDNSFAELPPAFHTRLMPTPLPAPYFVAASSKAAALVGLDPADLAHEDMVAVFSGNHVPPRAKPLSAVYSGHQFGHWAGQLGDGRAILLGGMRTPGGPMELQLKGAGMTPYSRMGDGRAVLRSSIREFLCSEAMAALGIPTTRALVITGSNQRVARETLETASVVTRMAPSFVRFGSFEHWHYRNKPEELRILADYVIDNFYPELRNEEQPYLALLAEVTRRTARLMAHWQAVGFMHGVMNTDNMSILGLTLDYGPFGFMEAFDVDHICNHTDQGGRYSYANQVPVGHWNCYALANALLPLIGEVEAAQAALEVYVDAYGEQFDALMHAKLGLGTVAEDDRALFDDMFKLMQANRVDFTLFFRRLGDLRVTALGMDAAAREALDAPLRDLFLDRPAFDAWAGRYRERLLQENSDDASRRAAMNRVNPKYILRNYLAQVAIEKAQDGDFSEVQRLLAVLERPFDDQRENDAYAALPPDWAAQLEVSCSS
ncbi:YdiU family protein [Massilia forsythiae]|uniref:Protein nucleotidyltransferase YdiU n=1 Tax=Massilia forsythiae TaxID=2728020 RepID=A0A7Z2ZU80_9BURK|nr:YdiU family protein [Massilia forsythiae]QJE02381.1 YdiU family protein [Massilia forsythiae]